MHDYKYGDGCTYASRDAHVAGLESAIAQLRQTIAASPWDQTFGQRVAAAVYLDQLAELKLMTFAAELS